VDIAKVREFPFYMRQSHPEGFHSALGLKQLLQIQPRVGNDNVLHADLSCHLQILVRERVYDHGKSHPATLSKRQKGTKKKTL